MKLDRKPKKCEYKGCNAWALRGDIYCKSHKALYMSKIESGVMGDSAYWDKLPDSMKSDYNVFMLGEPLQLSDEIALARTLLKEYISTVNKPEDTVDPRILKEYRDVIQNGVKLIDTLSRIAERFRKIQTEGIKLDIKISVDMLQLYLQHCIFPFIQDFEVKKKIAEASKSFSLDEIQRGRMMEKETFGTVDLSPDEYSEEDESVDEDIDDIIDSLDSDIVCYD